MRRPIAFAISFFLLALPEHSSRADATRKIPHPLPSHPGNIFVAGEHMSVSVPTNSGSSWRLNDYEGHLLRVISSSAGKAELGNLSVGYYELNGGESTNLAPVSVGIIEPLRAPTPLDSPVGIDVGMAWFFPKEEQMEQVASLCTLAGMNRVRDRLMWEEVEPRRGEFAGRNKYDLSAEVQTRAGLQVLQVSHVSPSWANPVGKRFPPDLRDVYRFCREMAKRWSGEVVAFEPWNEADIKEFGGHTGSEMAALQKAAYFGLKDGNSNIIACLNVFAIRRAATLKDFNRNEAWPYFDTFNLHHYEGLQNYPSLYADFRAVSGGKPMWVTECSVHVKWTGDEQLKELSMEDARLQSERLTKTYALSIYQGADATFYFVLPHYSERTLQYGILRSDLTPRPAYIAAAAVGRLLAGAKPRGRLDLPDNNGQAYCFSAEPDGKESDVVAVWTKRDVEWDLPAKPRQCFDHLGRKVPLSGSKLSVGMAPRFLIFDKGAVQSLIAPPKPARLLEGKPGRVVLQALLPEADTILDHSAYQISPGETKSFSLYAYNFSQAQVSGNVRCQAAEGWASDINANGKVEIEPNGRVEMPVKILCPSGATNAEQEIRFTGNFGPGLEPLLSIRFLPQPPNKKL